MGIVIGLVIGFIGGVVFDHLFFRANPDKKAVVDKFIDKV